MQEFIASRRDIDEPPGEELKDFEEYTHLYQLAWTDPANRWLLSTLPSAMIFDDHDIRDDWNTSASWRAEMEATSWWHDRIVGGLASYWIYQHLGNLSPDERAEDEIWKQIVTAWDAGDGEPDVGDLLDALAERADEYPETYRWSYARDIGSTRLIVVDSRAARVLKPEERLDPRRRRDGLARRPAARWIRPRAHRDVAAVPAVARPAPRSRRGTRRSRPVRGASGGRWSARRSGRTSTWSTGRRSRTVSGGGRAGHRGRQRQARHRAGDDHVPVRRRAQLLRRRGRPSLRRAGSCRRSAHRSATRCRTPSAT